MALYYIHYPRTGGTSLREMLIDRLDIKEVDICPYRAWREVSSIEQLKGYEFYSGHFGGYGLDSVLGDNPEYVATIRHPWTQLQSAYRYVMGADGVTGNAKKMRDMGLSFSDFLRVIPGNSMCMFYAADGPEKASIDHLADPISGNPKQGNESDLVLARLRLNQCKWIIDTDSYECDFERVFGVKPDRRLNNPNVEFRVTSQDREYVEEKWNLDIKLINFMAHSLA